MKKILSVLVVVALAALVASCESSSRGDVCLIDGTTNPRFDNKKIFLVPLYGPQDAPHVDSVVVKDCRFHFEKDTTEIAVIRLDYHVRTGVQDLLVVTEPGQLTVTIDSVSDAHGTPQNDSLSKWKAMSTEYNRARVQCVRAARAAQQAGDSATVARLAAEMDSLYTHHKQQTRSLAARLPDGVLKDFLEAMFPRTYQRQLPDGTIVTVDND